jgi:hypothetical protein
MRNYKKKNDVDIDYNVLPTHPIDQPLKQIPLKPRVADNAKISEQSKKQQAPIAKAQAGVEKPQASVAKAKPGVEKPQTTVAND